MAESVTAKIAELSPEAQQRVDACTAEPITQVQVARDGVSVDQVMMGWSDERRCHVEARARKLFDEALDFQSSSKLAATPWKPL